MSDLRTLHRRLPVSTPPFETVVANARRIRVRQLGSAAVVLGMIAALAGLSLAPAERTAERVPADGSRVEQSDEATTTTAAPGSPATTTTTTPRPHTVADDRAEPRSRSYACSREGNGGATDTGVTANQIRILASSHMSGPDSGLAQGAALATRTVVERANRAGGICGRLLDIRMVDKAFTRPVDPRDYLAVLPAPIDRDFDARLSDGSVDRWKVPVVIPDAFGRLHHRSTWGRAVGTSIASITRIAADEAYRAGARTFGLVHDPKYAYGEEAATALHDYVPRLPGASVRAVQALDAEKSSYGAEADAFAEQCGCDAVLLDLLPDTANRWLSRNPPMGSVRTAAMPFLLLPRFAADCANILGPDCRGLWVWSAFTPPIADFMADPDVKRYVDDVGEDNAMNPFTLASYASTQVLVAALQRTGPDLTRERFRYALDTMEFPSGLIDWSVRGSSARAVQVGDDEFVDAGTGWRRDPG